jgi:hypothetical protein
MVGLCGLDLCGSGYRQLVRCYENGKEYLVPLTGGHLLYM